MIHTIWHYGIAFESTKDGCKKHCPSKDAIYTGKIDDMPEEISRQIAEVHPKCVEYFENAMATLYKTYGAYKHGTEDPVYSLSSLRTGKEADFKYMVVWRIIGD